jgi:hypothetical protein
MEGERAALSAGLKASVSERDSALSEVAALRAEEHLLRAQNGSMATELEEIRADLDAFIVENEQLAVLVSHACADR